eukprot:jgi/Picsp_1/1476/NSC_04954-R1_---NA---
MEKVDGEMGSYKSKRYDILVDAEGAEDVAIEPGKEVSFLWRRNDKFYLSESSEVWDQGIVYWDACSTQDCTFYQMENDQWREKYLKVYVQEVMLGPDGLPKDFGSTVAQGFVELSQFINKPQDDSSDLQKIIVDLYPSGKMSLKIAATAADCSEDSSGALTNVSQFGGEDTVAPEPEIIGHGYTSWTPLALASMEDGRSQHEGENHEEEDIKTPTASTMSSSLVNSNCCGSACNDTMLSETKLKKKLVKATKQCEEARARAFSEASIAVQRGIEIDNLKRAKDVLLKRLETAEQQLMMVMKQDMSQDADWSGQHDNDIIHLLAETKVSLAEKEFEIMALQGRLRAREVQVESLIKQLEELRQSTPVSKDSLDSDTETNNVSLVTLGSSEEEVSSTSLQIQAAETTKEQTEKVVNINVRAAI